MERLLAQYRRYGNQSCREFLLERDARNRAPVDTVYETGVKICGREKSDLELRLERSTDLNWWYITIHHKTVLQ